MKLVFVAAVISMMAVHFLWSPLPIALIVYIWGTLIIAGSSVSIAIGRKWMKDIVRPNDGYEIENLKNYVQRAQFFTSFLFLIFIPIICNIIVICYKNTLEPLIGGAFPWFSFGIEAFTTFMIPSIGLKSFISINYRDIFSRFIAHKYQWGIIDSVSYDRVFIL